MQAVKSIDVCPVTGNIAVGSDESVDVHMVTIGADGIPLVTKIYSLLPKCTLERISLCKDYIAYGSSRELYILQARMAPLDKPDTHNNTPGGGDSPAAAAGDAGDAGAGVSQSSQPAPQSQCVTLSFDKDGQPTTATTVLGIEVPYTLHSQVLVKNDEYDTEERLGPLRVADHGMRAMRGSGFEVTECRQFLHVTNPPPSFIYRPPPLAQRGVRVSPIGCARPPPCPRPRPRPRPQGPRWR